MTLHILQRIKHACFIVTLSLFIPQAQSLAKEQVTSLTIHGLAKYPQNFSHFDYVNPKAPKGGILKMATVGTFDSLNPYIEKGTSPAGINLIYDSLMTQSHDEPFSVYPLIAEAVSLAEDNSSITFFINKNARFHDNHSITAEDVQYTFNLLLAKGSPFYKAYYGDVATVDIITPLSVKFTFKNLKNRELPLILSQLPVLPKHFWEKDDNVFEAANLSIPLGSGPYQVSSVEAGKHINYERVKNYWAAELSVNKGRHNIDHRRYDYYKDDNIAIEALKAREYDIRFEVSAKSWATAYDISAADEGLLKKEAIKTKSPEGIQGFAFNTRRDLFSDRLVRQALIYALDFEWLNRNLFYNSYTRSTSYFSNSEMESTGIPSEAEMKLLNPWRHILPKELFTQTYKVPVTDGSGNIRKQLNTALNLLRGAGWQLVDGQLENDKKQPFKFELLIAQAGIERVALPFKKNLEQIGIMVNIRYVDVSQYIHRLRTFDFDMTTVRILQSSNPGNEQREYWGSQSADTPSSKNLMGIKSPAIDSLIDHVINAVSREQQITAVKALDRALLWGEYVIPHWYSTELRAVYWNKLHHPKSDTLYSLDFQTWWINDEEMPTFSQTDNSSSSKQSIKDNNVTILIITLSGLLIFIGLWWLRRRKKSS